MHIDGYHIHVEHKQGTSALVMTGRPFGIKAMITPDQLESLIAELSREATAWRRRIIPDYYAILEVAPTATDDEIKTGYRQLMKNGIRTWAGRPTPRNC